MQYYQECIALGSKTGLSLVSTAAPAKIDDVYKDLWQQIFTFERRFSRFLPGSELSAFNRSAGLKQIVSPEFRALLVAARSLGENTAGLYNPFILPALQTAGYTHSRVPGYEDDPTDDYTNRTVVTVDRLEIGDDWARIPYGTALDLGGCGKGYLADNLRAKMPADISGYWLSLGGDIAVGGHDGNDQPWSVTIQSALDSSKTIGSLSVDIPSGIATSGTTVHQGKKAGKQWHHLIDPRTRQPADTDVLLATVRDTSLLRADVLASCAVILGSKQAVQFLKKQGAGAAVLQSKDSQGKLRVIHYGNGIIDDNHA